MATPKNKALYSRVKSEAKKKQVTSQLKEIKFRPNIEDHDLQTKLKKVYKFIAQGDKVKLLMQFRGREMAHKDLGFDIFNAMINGILEETNSQVESARSILGNRILAIVAPGKAKYLIKF